MREQVIQTILEQKIIVVLRGTRVDEAVAAARALSAGGIRLIEVTFDQRDPASFPETARAIRTIRETLGDRVLVGAGTVLTPAQVELAHDAGAEYIISPDADPSVIARTRALGLVSIPGAYTAGEARRAYDDGADFVKLFPCVGDAAAYLEKLCAPLNFIRFLAVGGVTAENCADFFRAGAVGIAVSGPLLKRAWLDAGDYDQITAAAQHLITAVRQAT